VHGGFRCRNLGPVLLLDATDLLIWRCLQ